MILGNSVDTVSETVFTEDMTTSERVRNLQVGERVTLTLNNERHEALTGRVASFSPYSIRLETCGRTVAISTDHGFIARVRRETP